MARAHTQPQGAAIIDWTNPITQGLVLAYSHTPSGPNGWSTSTGNTPSTYFSGTTVINSPTGVGLRSNSTSNRGYQIGGHGLNGQSYSLFAVCTAASNSVTQNVLDMDNSSPRYFQFQLSNGKSQIIPFNTGGGTTGIAATAGLSVAELNKGFTMGATVSPSRVAAFQNMQIATATPSSLVTVTNSLPVTVGARIVGTQGWISGGITMVASWNRALSDAEMFSLAQNPWQLFWVDDDLDWITFSGQSFSFNASGGFTTLGTAGKVYTKGYLTSGGPQSGGSAGYTTGYGTVSYSFTGSGGTSLSGASPSMKGARKSPTGGITTAGTASAFGSPQGGTNGGGSDGSTNKLRKRSRRPRIRIDPPSQNST